MARIRYVKPELFMDEDLGALSGDHTLLFVGLWTQADREGRLEDRQARLKVALFPYREVNLEALLVDLERVGKIVRYEVDGEHFIAIPGFAKHQRPHPKEPASTLPEPPSRVKKRPEISGKSCIPSSPVEGKREVEGKERNGKAEPPPPAPPKAEGLDAMAFGAWVTEERRRAFPNALTEVMDSGILIAWYRAALSEPGMTLERLRAAYLKFLRNEFWSRQRKPCPWNGFASQWTDFVDGQGGGGRPANRPRPPLSPEELRKLDEAGSARGSAS